MVDLERLDAALDRYDKQLENVELTATAYEALRLIYESASAHRDYLADPVAAAANLDGAEVREYRVPRNDMLPPGIYGLKAGRYLLIPLPDKETPNDL